MNLRKSVFISFGFTAVLCALAVAWDYPLLALIAFALGLGFFGVNAYLEKKKNG